MRELEALYVFEQNGGFSVNGVVYPFSYNLENLEAIERGIGKTITNIQQNVINLKVDALIRLIYLGLDKNGRSTEKDFKNEIKTSDLGLIDLFAAANYILLKLQYPRKSIDDIATMVSEFKEEDGEKK